MQTTGRKGPLRILDLAEVPQYLQTLAGWHHAQWQSLNPGLDLQQRLHNMQAYLDDSFIPTSYVAIGEVLFGSAAIIACDMEIRAELTPWLASVYVDPPYRCQGIGSRLVSHVMRQARSRGFERLYLYTPDQTAFYRRLGWQEIETLCYRGSMVTIMSVGLDVAPL